MEGIDRLHPMDQRREVVRQVAAQSSALSTSPGYSSPPTILTAAAHEEWSCRTIDEQMVLNLLETLMVKILGLDTRFFRPQLIWRYRHHYDKELADVALFKITIR